MLLFECSALCAHLCPRGSERLQTNGVLAIRLERKKKSSIPPPLFLHTDHSSLGRDMPQVDLGNTEKLLEGERGQKIRELDILCVGESGIFRSEDIDQLSNAGVGAVLVGESLVKVQRDSF